MNIVATWMYSSPQGSNYSHAQTGNKSSSQNTQNIYWRCVFLFFESSQRLNPGARHLLFVNERPPKFLNGIPTIKLIEQYSVELVILENFTLTELNYHGSWNTQFIVIDVLEWLALHVDRDDVVLILDSDMVFNKSLSPEFINQVKIHRALIYTLNYPLDHSINGLTRRQLFEIARQLNPNFPGEEFRYYGGEIICLLGTEIKQVARLARETFKECQKRASNSLLKFNEEAHLLSYVYAIMGFAPDTANPYIKRIWTDRSIYTNVDGYEDKLILWHLPGEKKYGFMRAFQTLKMVNGRLTPNFEQYIFNFRIKEYALDKLRTQIRTIVRKLFLSLKRLK